MMDHDAPSSLYIHIPFCIRKCAYCDFNSYSGLDALFAPYVDALLAEMRHAKAAIPGPLRTIYMGGGTPSMLPTGLLERILRGARQTWPWANDMELSVEANPGTLSADKLTTLKELGATRLSIGAQSMDDRLLRLLGRIHTASQTITTLHAARRAGFDNINLDLMYGLPTQSLSAWQTTLQQALELGADHLSLYALTLHATTPLARSIEGGQQPRPNDDAAADMYDWARETLQAHGYIHYEISNWAKEPPQDQPRDRFQCRHNLVYWDARPYLGVGAGAHGYLNGQRYWNDMDPQDYISQVATTGAARAGSEVIDRNTAISEYMILGLRRTDGVSFRNFAKRFALELQDLYTEPIKALCHAGLLVKDARGIRLSERGLLLGNEVFERFLLTT